MNFGDFWLQSNSNGKGKKFSLKDLHNLKPEDIAKNPKLQKLITLFDSDGSGNLETNELESIFADLKTAAKDDILSDNELGLYLSDKFKDQDIKVEDVKELLNAASDKQIQELNYTDLDGNNISDKFENGEIVERTITSQDVEGNKVEVNVFYENKKPVKQLQIVNNEIAATISYDYSKDPQNPTTTTIFKNKDGIVEEVNTPQKRTLTLYKTDSIDNFDKTKNHRLQQVVVTDKAQYVAEYDGKGNTLIIVQNSETPELIAQKFGVKLSDLGVNNKGVNKNTTLQAGQKLIIKGEYDADSKVMKPRKSEGEVKQKAAQHAFCKVYDKIFASAIDEYTIKAENAGKDVYEYAEKYLIRHGAKKTDANFNARKNDFANELIALNGRDAKYTAGSKIKYIKKTLDQATVNKLKDAGMIPNQENQLFFARFNYLTPQQQTNVIKVLKQCKAKGITDPQKINAEILRYYPEIQMFETDKKVLQKPTKAMARSYMAHYLLEQIDAIIAVYNQTATADQSLWTLGTGLIVELQDILHVSTKFINDNLGTCIAEGDSRVNLAPMLNKIRQECLNLVVLADMEEKNKDESFDKKKNIPEWEGSQFDKTFNALFYGKSMNYDAVITYLQAVQEFQKAPEKDRNNKNSLSYKKIEAATNKLNSQLPAFQDIAKRIESWSSGTQIVGGLTDLGVQVAMLYMSGGSAAIARSSMYVGNATRYSVGTAMGRMATSKFGSTAAGRLLVKDGTQFITREGSAILASMVTSSAETAAFFQGTKVLGALEDGKVTGEEVAVINEGFEGLFKFGMVGSAIAGPLGVKASELTSKLLNSEKAIASTMKMAIEGKGTTLDKVLKALCENSNAVSKITEFGTSFSINAGYMAVADNTSYSEAMGNLAQMDAVSKLVVAMLGGKNTAFLTPQKVQQIKTSLAGYEVKLSVYKGQKIYEVTDKAGAKTRLANEQELFLFIIDREVAELVDTQTGTKEQIPQYFTNLENETISKIKKQITDLRAIDFDKLPEVIELDKQLDSNNISKKEYKKEYKRIKDIIASKITNLENELINEWIANEPKVALWVEKYKNAQYGDNDQLFNNIKDFTMLCNLLKEEPSFERLLDSYIERTSNVQGYLIHPWDAAEEFSKFVELWIKYPTERDNIIKLLDYKSQSAKFYPLVNLNQPSMVAKYLKDSAENPLLVKLVNLKNGLLPIIDANKLIETFKDNKNLINDLIKNPDDNILLTALNKDNSDIISNRLIRSLISKYGRKDATFAEIIKHYNNFVEVKLYNGIYSYQILKIDCAETDNPKLISTENIKQEGTKTVVEQKLANGQSIEQIYRYEQYDRKEGISSDVRCKEFICEYEKIFKDTNGNIIKREIVKPSESLDNQYELNTTSNEEYGLITAQDGNITIINRLKSSSNVLTEYIYKQENNETNFDYTIYDKYGNILASTKRYHKQVDNNHTQSSINSTLYDIEFTDNEIRITKHNQLGEVETVVLGSDLIDFTNIEDYKTIPGDILVAMKKVVHGKIETTSISHHANADLASGSATLSHNQFVNIHELGHLIDEFIFNKLREDPELVEIYQRETLELMKNTNCQETNWILSHFTEKPKPHRPALGLGEIIAEGIATKSGKINTDCKALGMRTLLVMRHYPELLAKISNKYDKAFGIDSNIVLDKPIVTDAKVKGRVGSIELSEEGQKILDELNEIIKSGTKKDIERFNQLLDATKQLDDPEEVRAISIKIAELTKPETNIPEVSTERSELRDRARTENPAVVAEAKVKEEWQQHDLETKVAEEDVDLFNLDTDAGLKEPVTDNYNEVTNLILKGKLGETLTRKYEHANEVFKEILDKHRDDIEELANKYRFNNREYAQGIINILLKEFGMEEVELKARLVARTGGACNWHDGTIDISDMIDDKNELAEMISHEFVHLLQFREVLAEHGIKGLQQLIDDNKSMADIEKRILIQKINSNPKFFVQMLVNVKGQQSDVGSMNYYLRKIYQKETANPKGAGDGEAYFDELIEREAYRLGSNGHNLDIKLKDLSSEEATKLLKETDGRVKPGDFINFWDPETGNFKFPQYEPAEVKENDGMVTEQDLTEPQSKTQTSANTTFDVEKILKEEGLNDAVIKLLEAAGQKNTYAFYIKAAKDNNRQDILNEIKQDLANNLNNEELSQYKSEDISEYAISQFESIKDILFELVPNQDRFDISYITATQVFNCPKEQIDKFVRYIKENKNILKSTLPNDDTGFDVLLNTVKFNIENSFELPKEYLQKQIELIVKAQRHQVSINALDNLTKPKSTEEFINAYNEYMELFDAVTNNPNLKDKARFILDCDSWGDIKAIKEMYELMKDKLDYFENPEEYLNVHVDFIDTNSEGQKENIPGNFANKKATADKVIKLYEDLNLKKPLSKATIDNLFNNSDINDIQLELIKDIAKFDSEILYDSQKSKMLRTSLFYVKNENQKNYTIEIYKYILKHPDFEHKDQLLLHHGNHDNGQEKCQVEVLKKLLTLIDEKTSSENCRKCSVIVAFCKEPQNAQKMIDLIDIGVDDFDALQEFSLKRGFTSANVPEEDKYIADIKSKLNDPKVRQSTKDNIREFIKQNATGTALQNWQLFDRYKLMSMDNDMVSFMLNKWSLITRANGGKGDEYANYAQNLARVMKYEKLGVELKPSDIETLNKVWGPRGKHFSAYLYNDSLLEPLITNQKIQENLGRKLTIEEASYFQHMEDWKKDTIIASLTNRSNVYDVCSRFKSCCKNEIQGRLFILLEKNGYKINTKEGNTKIPVDNRLFATLTEENDIDAFCRIFEGEPIEESLAKTYIDIATTRGNITQNIEIVKQYPRITKAFMVTDRYHKDIFEILKNNTNTYTAEAFKVFDEFLEKHPEFETKMESLTADYSFMGRCTPLEDINSQEMLDTVKKNLSILEQIDSDIIKNGIGYNASVNGGLAIKDLLFSKDLDLEHLNILKPLLKKEPQNTQENISTVSNGYLDKIKDDKYRILLNIWANSYCSKIYRDINMLKKVVQKAESIEQLDRFLDRSRYSDPEFTGLLVDNLSVSLKQIAELASHRDYLETIEGNLLEKGKAIVRNSKKQGISDEITFLMLFNPNNVDQQLAEKILNKAANSITNPANMNYDNMVSLSDLMQMGSKDKHEAVLYQASEIAKRIDDGNIELAETLLDDTDFSTSLISNILYNHTQNSKVKNPAGAVNVAKTYKQNGITQNQAYLMMLNPAHVDKTFARTLLERARVEVLKQIEVEGAKEKEELSPCSLFKNVSEEEITRRVLARSSGIANIMSSDRAEFIKFLFNSPDFQSMEIEQLRHIITNNNPVEAFDLCKNYKRYEITFEQVVQILNSGGGVKARNIMALNKKMGKKFVSSLDGHDLKTASQFVDVIDVKNINEITIGGKKKFLRALVDNKEGSFKISENLRSRLPLVPRNVDEYCPLLRSIVRSIGIETEALTPEQRIQIVQTSISDLSKSIARLSDKDFADLDISLEFSREEFIEIVREKTKGLSDLEKVKVYDYYGFELHHNNRNLTGYSMTGYPVNLNNGAKLALIENPATKAVVESLREDVIRFSKDNKIKCNNPQVEQLLNEVLDGLPEIRTMVGKKQHLTFSPINDVTKLTEEIKSSFEYRNVIKMLEKMQLSDIQKLGLKIEDGVVICSNEKLKSAITALIEKFPEIKDSIGIVKTGSHDFDVMQHSLKVMQKIVQDPQFNNLNSSDKKIMLLASLLHDITKAEGRSDRTHASESSFDAFYIAQKFNLTREESLKLYTLIDNHEWLGEVNTKKTEESLTKALQKVAFHLQNDNLFELSLIFTHADLKAVRRDNSFHDKVDGPSRTNFRGEVHSFGEAADIHAERIREYIQELKANQPITPVTQIPTTDMIMSKVGSVDPDGKARDKAGNIIDGLYIRQSDGLVIIKHNEVTDWEALGFANGTTSKGITGVGKTRVPDDELGRHHKKIIEEEYETGNIHYFMHGLDYPNQLMKFEAFPLVDSRVMLSLTYLERPESKPRGFRPQGVLLDFRTKYVYGGGETDSGSGCGKFVDEFIKDYCFGGHRQKDRTMVSDLIKEAAGMTDEEYIKFVEENKNKQWSEVEPPELRNKLIKALADGIVSTERGYKRSYDEFYGSNPERVMATFAYNEDAAQLIGNAVEFVDNNNHRLNYLIQFNRDHKIPMVLLGD